MESLDEVYSPRGYLHLCTLLESQKIQLRDEVVQILSSCTQCGDCEPLCPIDLPIVQMIASALK